jgi:hypothetical protein
VVHRHIEEPRQHTVPPQEPTAVLPAGAEVSFMHVHCVPPATLSVQQLAMPQPHPPSLGQAALPQHTPGAPSTEGEQVRDDDPKSAV